LEGDIAAAVIFLQSLETARWEYPTLFKTAATCRAGFELLFGLITVGHPVTFRPEEKIIT
jgi:hypothetical protein